MKIIVLFLTLIFSFPFLAGSAYAVTAVEKDTSTLIEQQVNNLKERIASRVAQLKLVERRGIIGTVTEVSDTQITLSDVKNNTRFVDVDELTKFSSLSSKESFGISDITKGTTLSILGLYNKESRRILARFVNVVTFPTVIHGAVSGIDEENFTLTVATEEGEFTVDVENTTRTSSYTKGTALVRAGFSKIIQDMRITVIGTFDIKDKTNIIASRILLFPDIPKNPKIKIVAPLLNPQETIQPSTGSGKKLTPITR